MVVAAIRGAALSVSEEEKNLLLKIINSSEDSAAIKRAKIIMAARQGKTNEGAAKAAGSANSLVIEVKKQWRHSSLTGEEKVNKICFSKHGRRRNKEELANKVKRILHIDKKIDPEMSLNARAYKIVEVAIAQGFQVSHSTVRRALRDYQKELNL